MPVFFGTGFENISSGWMTGLTNGTVTFPPGSVPYGTIIGPLTKLRLTSSGPSGTPCYVRLPIPTGHDEIYVTLWLDPSGTDKGIRIEAETADLGTIGVRKPIGSGNIVFNGYINDDVLVNGGGYEVGEVLMHELYLKLHASSGRFVHRMTESDGTVILGIDYTGNTIPTASANIVDIKITVEAAGGDYSDFDDLTVADDGFPGDIRYAHLAPNGDSSVEWSPDSGAVNYSQLDERPPSSADYVSTTVDGERDLYDIENYARTERPQFIVLWHSALAGAPGAGLVPIISSGGVVEEAAPVLFTSSYLDYQSLFFTDPATATTWTNAALDALKVGQDSVVATGTITVRQVIVEVAYLANTVTSLGSRPLAMDITDFDSSFLFATVFNNGALYLQRYDASSLALQVEYSFGAATELEVDARDWFIVPFCPAYFTLGNFKNYVYVFGRWDSDGLGTAAHIALSTDGGLTFTSIGDATWTTQRVAAMWTTDSSTIHVVLNGASPALWRTTNGGTSWANLGAVPFNIEHQALTRHPDGRVLISRNTAGTPAAQYLDSPYTGAWTDATDSLPTVGTKPSIIWIT